MTENLESNINLNSEIHEKKGKFSKFGKVKKFAYAALVGMSLASCQSLNSEEQKNLDTLGDTSPMVQAGYQTYLENKSQGSQENMIQSTQGLNEPENFEVPATEQTIRPGSRVQVVETGGYGLNIRSEAGINSQLVSNALDGTIFKVIDIAGEKDGYHWVLVKSEAQEGQSEIVGYAAVDWFQVLRNEPIQ